MAIAMSIAITTANAVYMSYSNNYSYCVVSYGTVLCCIVLYALSYGILYYIILD